LCIYILWEAGCTSGVHPGGAAIFGHLTRFLRGEIELWLKGRAVTGMIVRGRSQIPASNHSDKAARSVETKYTGLVSAL
jgi:hypothetical protein